MERDIIDAQNKIQGVDTSLPINQYQIQNIIQTYTNVCKNIHTVDKHVILHLAKAKIMSSDGFKKIMEEIPEVKAKFIDKQTNSEINTFDIMRNYLNDDEMRKVLKYLVDDLGMTNLSSLILTANNLK